MKWTVGCVAALAMAMFVVGCGSDEPVDVQTEAKTLMTEVEKAISDKKFDDAEASMKKLMDTVKDDEALKKQAEDLKKTLEAAKKAAEGVDVPSIPQ